MHEIKIFNNIFTFIINRYKKKWYPFSFSLTNLYALKLLGVKSKATAQSTNSSKICVKRKVAQWKSN